jgi:hypothetical protein
VRAEVFVPLLVVRNRSGNSHSGSLSTMLLASHGFVLCEKVAGGFFFYVRDSYKFQAQLYLRAGNLFRLNYAGFSASITR